MNSDDLDAGFRAHIRPHLEAVERERLQLRNQCTSRLMIATSGMGLLILASLPVAERLREMGGDIHWIVVVCWLLFLLPVAAFLFKWALGPSRQYARRFKDRLLPAIADFFGNFSYNSEGGIPIGRLKESTLMSKRIYYYQDHFTGYYRDGGVDFCEARLGGSGHAPVTVFKGVFVLLTLNTDFKGRTVVRRVAGKLGNWFQGTFSPLEPVKLGDPTFEKHFKVYSDNQVEARYLLNPVFRTRLLKLSKTLGADELEAAFVGNQLMVKLPGRYLSNGPPFSLVRVALSLLPERSFRETPNLSLFEPGSIFKSLHDPRQFRHVVEEFRSILSIVDILRVHGQTGI